MSIWLILTPAIVWLVALTWGLSLVRRPAATIWKSFFPLRTSPPPYEGKAGQRGLVAFSRFVGWLLFVIATFITVMALLVAVGVVPPAQN